MTQAAAESTPSEAPAGAPSAPAPAGAPSGGGGGTSAQPTTPSAPPGTASPPAGPPGTGGSAQGAEGQPPGKSPEEPHVPWRKFREVQTEATRFRQAHQQEMGKATQQITALQRQVEESRQAREDYNTLEQLLEDNPDLAEQLFKRAGGGQGQPPARSAADPEVMNEVRQLRSMYEQDKKQQAEAQAAYTEKQENERTDTALGDTLKRLLVEHDLDEGWLPHARAYVLETARRIPNLEMDEVPYVFAEWARPMHGLLVKQLDKWRTGKFADQRTMPPSPNGNGAVMAAGRDAGGANDRTTARFLEEQLKARLGWRNE